MLYKCIKDFYVENYDDDGFSKDTYSRIPKDSIWELDKEPYRFIGDNDSIRLWRIWKSKKAKTVRWIEISNETFKECFEGVE